MLKKHGKTRKKTCFLEHRLTKCQPMLKKTWKKNKKKNMFFGA
jgi:hypothetical protein